MSPVLTRDLGDGPVAIATSGLVKRFGRNEALAGLELTVPEGAIYVLVGPNGAGKTTALRTLLGLIRPDSGTAEVLGHSAVEDGPWVRARTGYLADTQGFAYPRLNVREILAHHSAYFTAWDEDYAGHLIDALEVRVDARASTLSKGEARRVQLVMALAHRPPLLLLDEPTDGLDPLARDRVFSLLAEHVASTPTTILVSTHLIHELEGLGDCLGALIGGRLTAQLRRSELEQRLHRIRAEVGEGWEMPEDLAHAVVHGRSARGELNTVFWGEADSLAQRLGESGATVRQVGHLNLEEATRALLSRGISR